MTHTTTAQEADRAAASDAPHDHDYAAGRPGFRGMRLVGRDREWLVYACDLGHEFIAPRCRRIRRAGRCGRPAHPDSGPDQLCWQHMMGWRRS